MIWNRRNSYSSKTGNGNYFPGKGLALCLTMIVCVSGLNLFIANIRVLSDNPAHPTMLIPSPVVTQQVFSEPVKSQGCDGCDVKVTCAGLPGSNSQTANVEVQRLVIPVTSEQPSQSSSGTSRIDFQVSAVNCQPWQWCTDRPQLQFEAREHAMGFNVTRVTLQIGDREKSYDSSNALLTLPQTGEQGAWLEYWAISNHKEGQSPFFNFKYRFVRSSTIPNCFRFEVLGAGWEREAPSGSTLWNIFPPVEASIPDVLKQPPSALDLYSTNRYIYLSGHLIRSGQVNASGCPNGGLNANGAATPCGESAGEEKLFEWQNRYNEQIYTAALKYNIPARLLKGIMAQESQFWPSSDNPYELGLGMFTEHGADMLLNWNLGYYVSNCIPMYGTDACASGYSRLDANAQLMMRRSVIDKIGTDSEIDVLAAALYASAAQVDRMLYNVTRTEPSALTNYETMWMITTANYYAGSGCTGAALERINAGGLRLTWDQLVTQMDESCQVASHYVQNIFKTTFDSELLASEQK